MEITPFVKKVDILKIHFFTKMKTFLKRKLFLHNIILYRLKNFETMKLEKNWICFLVLLFKKKTFAVINQILFFPFTYKTALDHTSVMIEKVFVFLISKSNFSCE